MSRIEGAVNKSMSLVGAVAGKLRDSPLTAAARTMEVAGDSIDTPPFSDSQEAIDAWVAKIIRRRAVSSPSWQLSTQVKQL